METDTLFIFLLFLVVLALIGALLFVFRKNRGGYDERQELMRGKAASCAMYTFAGAYVVFILARAICGEKLSPYGTFAFTVSLFLAISVYAVYCIFKDSYFTDRQRPASYLLLSAGIVLSQSANCAKIFTGEITLEKNPDSIYWCSLVCMIAFAIVFIATLVKLIISKKERE